MLNIIAIMGRLTEDPAVRKTKDGKEFVTASLAVNSGLNPDGSEKVMFVDIICSAPCQTGFDYLNKGDQVAVSGRLEVYDYTSKDGANRRSFRIAVNALEFGQKKYDGEEAEEPSPAPAPKTENPRRQKK